MARLLRPVRAVAPAGQLCGIGLNSCTTEGLVSNFNSTAASMVQSRYLMGSAVGNGRIFLVGGVGGVPALDTVESVLW
jgi:hypothetical protein